MKPSDLFRSTDDVAYRPILRPRRGELTALHHLDPATAHLVTPIIEMSAPSRDAPHETVDLLHLIRESPPRTGTLAVDLGDVPDSGDPLCSPPLDLAERLGDERLTLLPVLRAGDSDRRLAEHGLAARMHLGRAVLRLQPHTEATGPAAGAVTERVLRGSGLEPDRIDLVIDLAAMACRDRADRVEDQAHRVVRWARTRGFRSVSVAAGAMPPNLDDLPTDEPVRVRRHDAALWARLAEPGVGYADYGVTSPVRRVGVHHRQLPTLRYTTDRDWWIYRWARRGGRGDDRCHDLCRTLVTSPQWPAAGSRFSWGDAEIARRARAAPGAGTASSWFAWSTSHHIAHVLRTLRGPVHPDPPARRDTRPPRARRPPGP
jgi:hypothetical protein